MNPVIRDLRRLAAEKKAIILAHYYCRPEVQESADFIGDSLALAQTAYASDAEMIVFAGVAFMAETAAILCPDKVVIPVNASAGCAMADMIAAEALREFKSKHKGIPVLTYVNSPAAVKAESDACCTSSNVVDMLKAMGSDTVIMTPDRNLAAFAQRQIPSINVIPWDGCCPIHDDILPEDAIALKNKYPSLKMAAHPECREGVLALADFVGSTSAIIKFCNQCPDDSFIILTEEGIRYQLEKNNPEKKFYFPQTRSMICKDMKRNTLEDIEKALLRTEPKVELDEKIRLQALKPLQRMLKSA